jgi:hypothetical protein
MDDSARSSWLFGLAGAAAGGPTLKVLGGVAQGIGAITKGVGALSKAASVAGGVLPLLSAGAMPWVLGLAAAGAAIGGIAWLLGSANREAEALAETIRTFDLNLDVGDVNAIEDNIALGEKTYQAYAEVNLVMTQESDAVWENFLEKYSDGKLTSREGRALKKEVNKMVDDTIEEAETEMEARVEAFREHLAALTVGDNVDMSALVGSVTGAYAKLYTSLSTTYFLTGEQIAQILALAVDPSVADLNAALMRMGIADAETRRKIIAEVEDGFLQIDRGLEKLGIADAETRQRVIALSAQNLSALAKELGGLNIPPEQMNGIAALLTGFATQADKQLRETGIAILDDPEVRAELVDAAMEGPQALAAAMAKYQLDDPDIAGKVKSILNADTLYAALKEIDPGLTDAQIAEIAALWNPSLQGVVDSIGAEQLLSDEAQTNLASGIATKTAALVEELKAYQTEFDAVLTAISAPGYAASEAELARIQELLEKIALVRTELNLVGDQALQYARSAAELTKAGMGDAGTFGTAMGYTAEKLKMDTAGIKNEYQAQIAALQTTLDGYNVALAEATRTGNAAEVAAAQRLVDATRQQILSLHLGQGDALEALKAQATQEINAYFDGLAKVFPEAAAQLEPFVLAFDGLLEIEKANLDGAVTDLEMQSIFTPEVMAKIFEMPPLTAEEIAAMSPLERADWVTQLATTLQEDLKTGLSGLEGNPLMEALLASLNAGNLEGLDLTLATGTLEGLFKTIDLKGAGGEIAGTLLGGIALGLTGGEEGAAVGEAGAGGGLTTATDAAADMSQALIDRTKEVLQSHSPSLVFVQIGKDITAGLAQGLNDTKGKVIAPFVALRTEMVSAGANLMDGLLSGINSMAGAVLARAQELANQVAATMQAALAIHSPSKLTYWMGEMVGQGLADGMEASRGRVSRAAQEQAEAAVPDVVVGGGETDGSAVPEGAGARVVNLHVTINSPTRVTLAEAAREFRRQAEALAMG